MWTILGITLYLIVCGGLYYFYTEALDWDEYSPTPLFASVFFPIAVPLLAGRWVAKYIHTKIQRYNYKN
jgi:ACR3 family arsenite efflux pump ArsB